MTSPTEQTPDTTGPQQPASAPEHTALAIGDISEVRDPGEFPARPAADAPPYGSPRAGMFHVQDTGDTSGYGGLIREPYTPPRSERPYGGYFDEVADALAVTMADRSVPESAIEQIAIA